MSAPQTMPRALVVLRVPRGAPAPDDAAIRSALAGDRARLALPPVAGVTYRVAGPYAIEIGGQALDEYCAWEV
jgi:hypothetical protein